MEATYDATVGAARLVLRALGLRITIDGDEQVPRVGPVVLASNHVSLLDFMLVGLAVGVFPEAGVSTSFTVRALMPGAVALAAETGAPLLPMAIWGPQRVATPHHRWDLRRGRPVTITVGRPYAVPPDADVDTETHRLGGVLQGLLDDLQSRPAHRLAPGERPWWQPAHLGGGAPTPAKARLREVTVPRRAVGPSWQPRRSA